MTADSRVRPGTAPPRGGSAARLLSARQVRAIPFLAAAVSVKVGCEASGIGLRTFRTWAKQEAFRSALEAARNELAKEAFS
jgi:hypothetical protein